MDLQTSHRVHPPCNSNVPNSKCIKSTPGQTEQRSVRPILKKYSCAVSSTCLLCYRQHAHTLPCVADIRYDRVCPLVVVVEFRREKKRGARALRVRGRLRSPSGMATSSASGYLGGAHPTVNLMHVATKAAPALVYLLCTSICVGEHPLSVCLSVCLSVSSRIAPSCARQMRAEAGRGLNLVRKCMPVYLSVCLTV